MGYDVTEAFYVNDLGAQIGLTALAYTKCYGLLKPTMKALRCPTALPQPHCPTALPLPPTADRCL